MKFNLLILSVLFLASCGPTISGKDEQSFKASKAIMEEKLAKEDKERLEIALRVIIMKAMKEKWDKPNDVKYKGKSFNAISMAMIDGKSFSGIVDEAEDFLKEDRDKNIEQTSKEIDSLMKEKEKFTAVNKKMDLLKLTKIGIVEEEDFDQKVPYVAYTLKNNTGSEILAYMIQVDVVSKKTGKLLSSIQSGNRSEIDGDVKDGDGVKLGEEISMDQSLNAIEKTSNLFKNPKFPITDFSKLDFEIKVFPALIITRKEKMVRSNGLENLDKKIKLLQEELKELKETKGTLDELELTR